MSYALLHSQPAVLLNANARGVGPSVSKLIGQALPEAEVFSSHNLGEAEELAKKILIISYNPVLLGGGDGTLMGFLEALLKASKQLRQPLPELGLLRLGTGNAIARWMGQRGGKQALFRALRHIAERNERTHKSLNLLEFAGRIAPFAGAGLDGRVLGDYVRFKERSSQKPWKRMAGGMKGYVASVAFQTIPYYLRHPTQIRCQVHNLGERAHRVYPNGSLGPALAKGALLYEGEASMVAASTIPFYGYGIRMFPFAERLPRGMHLRVLSLNSIPRLLLNLHSLWKGRWFPQGMHDFVVEEAMVSCVEPMPCQVGGDAAGEHKTMHLKLFETAIPLIDFGTPAA
jgi:diacylglycerol kinase family enzyme